jgi:hypothetical protein
VAIFYVLIYIEISKKSGIVAIVDDAPSWIVLAREDQHVINIDRQE